MKILLITLSVGIVFLFLLTLIGLPSFVGENQEPINARQESKSPSEQKPEPHLLEPAPIQNNRSEQVQVVQRPAPVPEDVYGQLVSLEGARSRAGFQVLVPTELPVGITIQRVRLIPSQMVTIYYSDGFRIIQIKEQPSNITKMVEGALKANRDSPSHYKPILQRFTYADADGFGSDPWFYVSGFGEQVWNPGEISFRRNVGQNTIHYNLVGNFSFADLKEIAISMIDNS